MNSKIIQKDITFDINFTCNVFQIKKNVKIFEEKYNVESVTKQWSIFNPFMIKARVRVNISHDVDVDKMIKKQHELLMKSKKEK